MSILKKEATKEVAKMKSKDSLWYAEAMDGFEKKIREAIKYDMDKVFIATQTGHNLGWANESNANASTKIVYKLKKDISALGFNCYIMNKGYPNVCNYVVVIL